jgi:hypothetical protein
MFAPPRLRRAIGLVAVPGLALVTLVALPSAPAAAAEPDPLPAAAGAAWLEGQLTDGVLHDDNFDVNSYGLTLDLGLALAELGGHDATIDAVSTRLAAHVADPGDEFPYLGDGTVESYAGALAKAAVFAEAAGDDAANFGGVDLIDRLEARVSDAGPTLGRIEDASEFGDFANVIGQSFAVRALDEAGSTLTDSATDFLLAQQCEEGFFRQDFSAIDAPDQSCDGTDDAPQDTDVTALAVLALQGQADDLDVQEHLDAAVAWLLETQNDNGSFGASPLIQQANTNSTGLAGWALGETENVAAAARAAAFVRAHQVDEPAPCSSALNDDQGAIAYDIAALNNGREDGITVQLQDQWRRASAQALPVLQWAPGAGTAADIETKPFYKAGSRVKLLANGVAPGDTVCFRRGGKPAGLALAGFDGVADLNVRLPKGTATRRYLSSTGESEGQPLVFQVLDATRLQLGLKRAVARGGTQVVKISGLVEGEHFKVTYRGKRVDNGIATAKGRGVARFKVGKKVGPTRIVALGEYSNRRAPRTFIVTR